MVPLAVWRADFSRLCMSTGHPCVYLASVTWTTSASPSLPSSLPTMGSHAWALAHSWYKGHCIKTGYPGAHSRTLGMVQEERTLQHYVQEREASLGFSSSVLSSFPIHFLLPPSSLPPFPFCLPFLIFFTWWMKVNKRWFASLLCRQDIVLLEPSGLVSFLSWFRGAVLGIAYQAHFICFLRISWDRALTTSCGSLTQLSLVVKSNMTTQCIIKTVMHWKVKGGSH